MTAMGVTGVTRGRGVSVPVSAPGRSPLTISDAVNCPSSRQAPFRGSAAVRLDTLYSSAEPQN